MAGDFEYQWGQLVARAWADPAFKARLLADPAAVLEENGLAPAGKQFKVVEDTDEVVHLVLPGRPGPQELSEEELQPVAVGRATRAASAAARNATAAARAATAAAKAVTVASAAGSGVPAARCAARGSPTPRRRGRRHPSPVGRSPDARSLP